MKELKNKHNVLISKKRKRDISTNNEHNSNNTINNNTNNNKNDKLCNFFNFLSVLENNRNKRCHICNANLEKISAPKVLVFFGQSNNNKNENNRNKKNLICLSCLIKNKDKISKYIILPKYNNIFSSIWTIGEEINFIKSLEKNGLDNWEDISEDLKTKNPVQCEAHYYTFFNTNNMNEMKDNIVYNQNSLIDENKLNENDRKEIKNFEKYIYISKNKKEYNFNYRKLDTCKEKGLAKILEYREKRGEFQINYKDCFEYELEDIELDENDENYNNKLEIIKIYNEYILNKRKLLQNFLINSEVISNSYNNKTNNFNLNSENGYKKLNKKLLPLQLFCDKNEYNQLMCSTLSIDMIKNKIDYLKKMKNNIKNNK